MRILLGLKAPLIALFVVLISVPGIARAEEGAANTQEPVMCPFCLKANDPGVSYMDKTGNTLVRGVLNTTLGWTELLRLPAKEARKGRNTRNVLNGIGKGLGSGVTRTLNGLAEIVTFWTPKVQGEYVHFSKDCPLDTNQ